MLILMQGILINNLPAYGFFVRFRNLMYKTKGTFRITSHNFNTSIGHSFGGKYIEVRPNKFLQYTETLMFQTYQLQWKLLLSLKKRLGMEIKILQENIPIMIPVETCYRGQVGRAQHP